jgi:hypothetical protein
MRFQDIPQFTKSAGYSIHVGLDYLPRQLAHYVMDYGLDVCPDFQRGYVWTPEQKVRFMEYMLRGGTSGLDIYFNSPTWQHGSLTPTDRDTWFVLVDGKQRLDAAIGFLNNEVPVFGGHYRKDFTDSPRITAANFRFHVNDLKTREECLQWYLDLNSGGTVHTGDELEKVRTMISDGQAYNKPSPQELESLAGLERGLFMDEVNEIRAERARREEYARNPPPPPKKPLKKAKRR